MAMRFLMLATAIAAAALPVTAATTRTAAHTPAVGSAERRAVLDALRPSVEAKFGVPIEFVPDQLCVLGGWAVVLADPRRKGGGEVPWRNAMSRDEYDLGGIQISAVMRYRGGRWNLVDSAIGATDVWYENLIPPGLTASC